MADNLIHPITGMENSQQGSLLGLYLKSFTTVAGGGVCVLPNVASSVHSVSPDSRIKMEILSLAAETIALTGSVNATDYSDALIPISATTGNYYSSATLTNGQYLFPATWAFTHYKLTKSSATDTCVVAIAYNTAPK